MLEFMIDIYDVFKEWCEDVYNCIKPKNKRGIMKTIKIVLMAVVTTILGIIAALVLLPKKVTTTVLAKDADLVNRINDIKAKIASHNKPTDNVDEDWFHE